MQKVTKKIKHLLNNILKKRGLRIIPLYELEYLKQKNYEMCGEIEGFFQEFIFPNIPHTKGRDLLIGQLFGTSVSKALYLIHYLHQTMPLKGDVCEFGIANGATSALLANEIKTSNKKIVFI